MAKEESCRPALCTWRGAGGAVGHGALMPTLCFLFLPRVSEPDPRGLSGHAGSVPMAQPEGPEQKAQSQQEDTSDPVHTPMYTYIHTCRHTHGGKGVLQLAGNDPGGK